MDLREITLSRFLIPLKAVITAYLVVLSVGFGLSHVKLHMALGDGNTSLFPSTEVIAEHFRGEARLKRVVLNEMKPYFSASEDTQLKPNEQKKVDTVVDWVRRGAPEEEYWDKQSHAPAKILTILNDAGCIDCHSPNATRNGNKKDSPLDTYAAIQKFTEPGSKADVARLVTHSHIHLFGMSFIFLSIALPLAFTGWSVPLRTLLSVSGFASILLDVGGWWAVRYGGAPFVPMVMAGGTLMAASFGFGVLAVLTDLWLRNRFFAVARLKAEPAATCVLQ